MSRRIALASAHGEPIRISPQMAAAAEQASHEVVHGVRHLVRDVRDAWTLRFSPAVHAQQLAVHTTRRVVTLSGTVPSQAAGSAGVRVVSDVAGVRRPTDALLVVS